MEEAYNGYYDDQDNVNAVKQMSISTKEEKQKAWNEGKVILRSRWDQKTQTWV